MSSMDIRLTPKKVRQLTASDLGVEPARAPTPASSSLGEIERLEEDDPLLQQVRDLLGSYGGIIFVGPPGTSKSWYAARIGFTLTDGDAERFRLVQFHPSYQYEDFVEGYVPVPRDGFQLSPKHLLEMCTIAAKDPERLVVLVIDELSRGDPGRVFGEALTYLEKTKRGIPFFLASKTPLTIPENLVILATMNPLDRGVDEVDAALERRFAKIPMDPNADTLDRFLVEAEMADDLRQRVGGFFRFVNSRVASNPFAVLGHTYFVGVSDEDGLRRVWDHQLRFHFEKAYRLDPDGRAEIFQRWDHVLGLPEATAPQEAEGVTGPAISGEPS